MHAFVNDLERSVGTYLYGRRMYETMAAWETDATLAAGSEHMRDFAQVWQAAEKVVYSRTLDMASTRKTRIERDFDPAPIIVGGGKPSLPDDVRLELELLAERRFDGGVVHLRYRAVT